MKKQTFILLEWPPMQKNTIKSEVHCADDWDGNIASSSLAKTPRLVVNP